MNELASPLVAWASGPSSMDVETICTCVGLLGTTGEAEKSQERVDLKLFENCSLGVLLNASKGTKLLFWGSSEQQSSISLGNAKSSPPSKRIDSMEAEFLNLNAASQDDNVKASRTQVNINKANPWKWMEFVKLNSVDRCKALAADGNSINIDANSTNGNTLKLEKALLGKLMGKRFPFHFVGNELKCKWGHVGNIKLILVARDCFISIF